MTYKVGDNVGKVYTLSLTADQLNSLFSALACANQAQLRLARTVEDGSTIQAMHDSQAKEFRVLNAGISGQIAKQKGKHG